jgi:hypothetical protein
MTRYNRIETMNTENLVAVNIVVVRVLEALK